MNRRVMRRAWELAKPELDRIDPSGHYEPANIRFIEKTENYKRRRLIDDTFSKCCGKPVYVITDTTEETSCYECSKCGDACDVKGVK